MLKKCLAIAALCATSANLCHAATVEVTVDTNNTIPNIIANSIIADGEGIDWTGGVIRVDLTSGSVYNGVPDGNTPQSAFWSIPGFVELEWDTWFGVPYDGTNGIAGGCAATDCTPFRIFWNVIEVTWFNASTTDTGVNRIGNISLTDDAHGTWSMLTQFAGGVLLQTSGDVVNGEMVPEPASFALLGMSVLSLHRRSSSGRKQAC